MNVDSINDPSNKLNLYINQSIIGTNKSIFDPLIKVYLLLCRSIKNKSKLIYFIFSSN